MDSTKARQQLIDYAQQLNSSGLSVGMSGNISVRCDEGLLITPSAVDYQQLRPKDIVLLEPFGAVTANQNRQPSSEWHFHCGLYLSRPDINAIVHAHPTYCTALACTGRDIPAFHYMVAVAGGSSIPLAAYHLFGSEALSEAVVKTLQHRQACLLANHGMITLGDDLGKAFKLALETESLAQQYCEALKLGDVKLLSDQQMAAVIDQFKTYGQRV
jgi:L-fuculose-phosphate aldolase